MTKFLLTCLIGYIVIWLGILLANIAIFIFTGFGAALAFSNDPIIIFIKNLMNISLDIWFYIPAIAFYLIPLLFYGLIYSILIKGIYVNINIKKFLNEKSRYQK